MASNKSPSSFSPNGAPGNIGNGDHSVIQFQSKPWVFFGNFDLGNATSVARRDSLGAWYKWNGSAFASAGIGGISPEVAHMWGRSASKSTDGELYLTGFVINEPNNQIRIARSTTGTAFTNSPTPLLTWSDSGERISYPSIVPQGGDSYLDSWSTQAQLFYGLDDMTYSGSGVVAPVDGANRKLVQRSVAISNSSSGQDEAYISLDRYFSSSESNHRVTTQVVEPGYAYEFTLGYLVSSAISGSHAVYECYIPGWNDHFVSTDSACEGFSFIRRLGFAYDSPAAGRSEITRCYIPMWTDHFVGNGPAGCGGWTVEMSLGYVQN